MIDRTIGLGFIKPLPGLVLEAAAKLDIELAASILRGDRLRTGP